MNLSKQKVKYICEFNKDLNIEEYYKRIYLTELNMWGAKRKISKTTFKKREKEGYEVEYRNVKLEFKIVKGKIEDIYNMIDAALDTKDKEWFMELTDRINFFTSLIK